MSMTYICPSTIYMLMGRKVDPPYILRTLAPSQRGVVFTMLSFLRTYPIHATGCGLLILRGIFHDQHQVSIYDMALLNGSMLDC
jgi:hypothetical protein